MAVALVDDRNNSDSFWAVSIVGKTNGEVKSRWRQLMILVNRTSLMLSFYNTCGLFEHFWSVFGSGGGGVCSLIAKDANKDHKIQIDGGMVPMNSG